MLPSSAASLAITMATQQKVKIALQPADEQRPSIIQPMRLEKRSSRTSKGK
jgi:hypothetical protein